MGAEAQALVENDSSRARASGLSLVQAPFVRHGTRGDPREVVGGIGVAIAVAIERRARHRYTDAESGRRRDERRLAGAELAGDRHASPGLKSAAGRAADVLFTSVPDDVVLESVASGSDGILAGLAAPKVWVDVSTVSPGVTLALSFDLPVHIFLGLLLLPLVSLKLASTSWASCATTATMSRTDSQGGPGPYFGHLLHCSSPRR
jgi:hypothetical protein